MSESDQAAQPVVPLRRNLQYQLLWVGSATSALGSQMSTLAFPLIILALTGSGALAGVVGATTLAADILVGFPAGALVDRWDRRRIILWCEAARMLGLSVVAVAVLAGWASIPLFLIVAVVQGAAGALVYPARAVTIRRVVPTEQLPAAYAQEEARSHGAALLGPPLGGALFGVARALPFVADAISYLVSFCCAALARIPRHSATAAAEPAERPGIVQEVREGLGWLRTERSLRVMLALLPVINVAGAAVPLLTILILRQQHTSAGVIGLVMAAEGVAGLLGSVIAGRVAKALPPGWLLLLIVWTWAALVALLALPVGAWWVAIVLGCGVLVTPALGVVVSTHIARVTPEELMGRTMATFGTIAVLFNPLGPLVGGALAQFAGPTWALLAFSAYLAVCALLATTSRPLRAVRWPRPGAVVPEQRDADAADAPVNT